MLFGSETQECTPSLKRLRPLISWEQHGGGDAGGVAPLQPLGLPCQRTSDAGSPEQQLYLTGRVMQNVPPLQDLSESFYH